ncbi:MAG: ABC transporter substrate-binding protein [Oricola sp.]|nr:MAG: ABC transporter substrate-binding protein [Oricola sp.]
MTEWNARLRTLVGLTLGCSLGVGTALADERPETLDIGVFTFVSGPAATYGVPGQQAAELMVDLINDAGGIEGVPVSMTLVDEAQGAEGVITEYRRLAEDAGYGAAIAALSSGNCLALAPLSDQLEMPTVAWNCDTHQLFLNNETDFMFRPNGNTVPEFSAFAAYMMAADPDIRTVAVINPDYSFGHDASAILQAALNSINSDVEVVVELFPRLGAGTYQTEISRLAALRPDAIFSNLWGADLENFVRQAAPRGLFSQSQVVLALGETILQTVDVPEGTIVGVLGDGYWRSDVAQANERTLAFVEAYRERFGENPVFPAMKMANAFITLEAAYGRAVASNGEWPNRQELADAFEGLEVETLTGSIRLRDDNDAIVDQIVGRVAQNDGVLVMTDIVRFDGEAFMPPVGEDPIAWIGAQDASVFAAPN